MTTDWSFPAGEVPPPRLHLTNENDLAHRYWEEHEYNGARITRMADVVRRPVEWLWPGRIPRGAITLLDGDPEVGKSTITLDLAARLSTGATPPDSRWERRSPEATLLVGAEDALDTTVRPRLEAAGAALQHISCLEAVYTDSEPNGRPLRLPTDVPALHRAVLNTDASLVVIDPIMSFIDADVNSSIDQDVRRVLWPLGRMADETGAAVVIVRHLTKGSVGGPALYRGGGSMGIIGAARSALMAQRDPEDPTGTTCVLTHTKCNLARRSQPLDYKVVADPLPGMGRIIWEDETA